MSLKLAAQRNTQYLFTQLLATKIKGTFKIPKVYHILLIWEILRQFCALFTRELPLLPAKQKKMPEELSFIFY